MKAEGAPDVTRTSQPHLLTPRLIMPSSGTRASFGQTSGISDLRRRFNALNSALRNEGHNPLEAVALFAAALEGSESAVERLSDSVRRQIATLVAQPDAGGGALSIAFQEFLVSEARNGLGQYLTPLPIADLIATIAATVGPLSALDPFAGSGLLLERLAEHQPTARLCAIEINRSAACVARAVGQLARRRIEVRVADAFALWVQGEIPQVDAVLTNPPFGAVATTVAPIDLWSVQVPASLLGLGKIPAELLGLEMSVSILREGGFLGIILPQSVLTNSRWGQYRISLLNRIKPIAVVSLPEETFAPFRGVAKACILFAQKRESSLPVGFPYLRSRAVGYDETGRPTGISDLDEVTAALLDGRPITQATVDERGVFLVPPALSNGSDTSQYHMLGEIANIFTGRTLARDKYASAGPRLLKVGDLTGSFIAWRRRPRSHVPKEIFDKHPRLHLRVGDICLTAAAHRPRYIGLKVDLVDEVPHEGAMASAEVLVIRLKGDAPIRAEQLLFYLRSEAGYTQLQDLVRGSTAHLYASDVSGLLIPPLEKNGRAAAIAAKFWEAAAAFRIYLSLEAEASELGTPPGTALPDVMIEDP